MSPGQTVLDLGRPWRRRRRPSRPATRTTGTRLGLLLAFLVLPFALVAAASPASAETCFAGTAELGCISGTIRTEVDVVRRRRRPGHRSRRFRGDRDQRRARQVERHGHRARRVHRDGRRGDAARRTSASPATRARVTVNITNLAQAKAVTFGVRTGDYSAAVSHERPDHPQHRSAGSGSGLLLALASIGLSLIYGTTGLSNFAHAEQVTMGGMLGLPGRQPVGRQRLARLRAGGRVLRGHRLSPGPWHLAAVAHGGAWGWRR